MLVYGAGELLFFVTLRNQ